VQITVALPSVDSSNFFNDNTFFINRQEPKAIKVVKATGISPQEG
jgi:hypothetical protein